MIRERHKSDFSTIVVFSRLPFTLDNTPHAMDKKLIFKNDLSLKEIVDNHAFSNSSIALFPSRIYSRDRKFIFKNHHIPSKEIAAKLYSQPGFFQSSFLALSPSFETHFTFDGQVIFKNGLLTAVTSNYYGHFIQDIIHLSLLLIRTSYSVHPSYCFYSDQLAESAKRHLAQDFSKSKSNQTARLGFFAQTKQNHQDCNKEYFRPKNVVQARVFSRTFSDFKKNPVTRE